MINKLIINADDLGLSLGVNEAILRAHNEGYLTHASLMANTDFFDHAVKEIIPKSKKLKIGFHINLTCCKALSKNCEIADNKGILSNNFIKLLFLRKTKRILESIENEIETQLLKLKNHNVEISHIDGHEHIHIIPSINKIVHKLAKKYNIERIREINEDVSTSFKYNLGTANKVNIVKLMLLKFLSLFNNNTKKIEFYSILNTCEINSENLFSYLEAVEGKTIEIMLHPSLKELDMEALNLDVRFIDFLRSDFRKQEFDLCFNSKFKNYAFFRN